MNSQRPSCLCLLSPGIKGMCHHFLCHHNSLGKYDRASHKSLRTAACGLNVRLAGSQQDSFLFLMLRKPVSGKARLRQRCSACFYQLKTEYLHKFNLTHIFSRQKTISFSDTQSLNIITYIKQPFALLFFLVLLVTCCPCLLSHLGKNFHLQLGKWLSKCSAYHASRRI